MNTDNNQPTRRATMTDRTDHRAEAEWRLTAAHEWAARYYARSPEDRERASLACATVHALLAIHDALTAKPCDDCAKHDRYAANEERQREEADMDEVLALGRKAGKRWSRTLDLLKQAEAEEREAAEPDPLDESDHRDRLDRSGDLVRRKPNGHWAWVAPWFNAVDGWTLSSLNALHGPFTFAPEPPPEDSSTHYYRTNIAAADGTAWSWGVAECHCNRPWRHE